MLTDLQREIQGLAREFTRGEIRPHAARWDEARDFGPEVLASLAELGFLGLRVPEAYGGLGLDWPTSLLVLETLAHGDAAVALTVAFHAGALTELILRHGSDAQKARWLPDLASGQTLGTVAFPANDAATGDDAVRARPDGGRWRLDGSAGWVASGGRAGLTAVFGRPVDGQDGLLCFLIELPDEGYTVGERARTMGLRAAEWVRVTLHGLELEEDCLLGGAGEGRRYGQEALVVTRVAVAALATGIARAALEHARTYATEREQFERPIAEFGAIREKLAEMGAGIHGAEALLYANGELLEQAGGDGLPESEAGRLAARAAAARLLAGRTAVRVADEAVQIFGGYGLMRDYPVEKLLRDAKGMEMMGGTGEALLEVVAAEVLAAPPG